MASFRMEGHGKMTGVFSVHWTVEPITPPIPQRHCGGCGDIRPFLSSGRIRLNANGRKADAWLIYKCAACDRTWNRPVAERLPVAAIRHADLEAMQGSDPAWVRAREFDLAALRRYCDRIKLCPEVRVAKTATDGVPGLWSTVVLTIDAPRPTGQRLDRLLAAELKVSRSCLQAMDRAGALEIEPASRTGLKKPVGGRVGVRFIASRLPEAHRLSLPGLLSG